MKINLKNLLQRCANKKDYVLLHEGFINNCGLSQEERSALLKLAKEMEISNFVIIFDNIVIALYKTSYNGGYTLAGLEFKKVEHW